MSSIQHVKIHLQPEHSFSVHHDTGPFFLNKLHYHAELELVYIINGSGQQFIGDSIHYFKSGDMILVGENLPHLWRSDEGDLSKEASPTYESYVIHFPGDCFGKEFFYLPENKNLLALLHKAKQGIRISGKTKSEIVLLMQEILNASSTKRILLLIKMLDIIATSGSIKTICKQPAHFTPSDSERINAICEYIMRNYDQKLPLKKIAAFAHLSPNSFCRYFKSKLKKSFSQFLIELRVEQACKLLSETEKAVGEICYECGYNSFSNFNKHFKMITKKSPLQYRKNYQKVAF